MSKRCICGLVALSALSGCSHGGHSIVGTWIADPDAQHHLAGETVTYRADGTYDEDLSMTDPNLPKPIDFITKGTWKEISEDHYQKQTTDIDMSKLSPPGMDAAAAAKMGQEQKPNFIKTFNKNGGFTAAWNGNDSFTVSGAGHATRTYHRKA